MATVKEELTALIQKQPDDSSREEIIRELAFHVMVERGQSQRWLQYAGFVSRGGSRPTISPYEHGCLTSVN